ncbi:MAG: hypothetical protein MI864_01775 [Pseudomonadales bacterium]|nr:hypothetical protein [Pseudomonadales bacterium]
MKVITRILLSIACLFAAIACYTFGIPAGGILFLFLGFMLEGLFWFGLFGQKRQKAPIR